MLSARATSARAVVGSPHYLSPEVCEDRPYSEKSDVWALGVSLYECCMQRHPFTADNQGALVLKILRGTYPAIQGPYSWELRELIRACLTQVRVAGERRAVGWRAAGPAGFRVNGGPQGPLGGAAGSGRTSQAAAGWPASCRPTPLEGGMGTHVPVLTRAACGSRQGWLAHGLVDEAQGWRGAPLAIMLRAENGSGYSQHVCLPLPLQASLLSQQHCMQHTPRAQRT